MRSAVLSYGVIGWAFLLTLLLEGGCISPFPTSVVYYCADEDTGEVLTVEGNTSFNNVSASGVHVYLVNEDNVVTDKMVTDSTGYYWFEVEKDGTYTLLAGDDESMPALMDVREVPLSFEQGENIVHLELSAVSNDSTAAFDTNSCSCEAQVWYFSLLCCGSALTESCTWEWVTCEE